MTRINPNIITYQLNINPMIKHVKQKRKRFTPQRNKIINEEVKKLLAIESLKEVQYLDWLVNVIVIQKKNEK